MSAPSTRLLSERNPEVGELVRLRAKAQSTLEQWAIRRKRESAKDEQNQAFRALVLAAHRGEHEAIVALDALVEQQKADSTQSRSAA